MKKFLMMPLVLLPLAGFAQGPAISMGNGEANSIVTDGATRDGATLTFPQVLIEGEGWLVLHPFKDGKPQGEVVAGYAPVASGLSGNVAVTVDPAPETGDLFIVMLHSDANANGRFDFVFINEREVVDKAVFEGSKMIGQVYLVP